MLRLSERRSARNQYEVLLLGAHGDDLEIGCGGTVLRLLREGRLGRVTWVVLSGDRERAREARTAARRVLGRHREARIVQQTFRDGYFPYTAAHLKDFFGALRKEVDPDVVFTHCRDDRHQDHRLVSELTYQTFRDHLILEYEVPKKDGDVGQPSLYVPLDSATVRRKISILLGGFGTQRERPWFTEDAFRGLMRLRGVEAGTGHAEAFYVRKLVF